MNVYQVKKLDDSLGGLAYRPGYDQSQVGAVVGAEPLYFASLAGAEKHLSSLSCDISKALSTNSLQRTYRSHLGQFVVTEIPVQEDAQPEVASEPKAES